MERAHILLEDQRLLPSQALLSPEQEEKQLMDEYNREYKFRPSAYPIDKQVRLQALMRRRSRVVTPEQAPLLRGTPEPGTGFEESCTLNNTGKVLLPKEK